MTNCHWVKYKIFKESQVTHMLQTAVGNNLLNNVPTCFKIKAPLLYFDCSPVTPFETITVISAKTGPVECH